MALKYEEIQRLKWELGFNAVNVGAEIYVLNGYAAVFDAAIAPYLIDQGSVSATVLTAQPAPTTVAVTVAANPPIKGAVVNVYGQAFQVGTKVVVDVGPNQETDVIVQSVDPTGLVLTMALQNEHGTLAGYPIVLQSGEYIARDILVRLDILNQQLKGIAPVTAGVAQADEVKFFAHKAGGRQGGQSDVFGGLMAQRDMARKDLAALLGIQNLWELRGKNPDSGSLSFGRY
jgi:hypothetical protein